MLNFYVVFDSNKNVFFPNTEVTATVVLHTDQTIRARKIDVKIIGRAKAYWYELEFVNTTNYNDPYCQNNTTDTRSVLYYSEMMYLNSYAILWASPDGLNLLPPGQYSFPVKFLIPQNAPPNMGGEYGGVNYFIKANIDIPWAIDEKRFVGFSVCPLIDLNFDPKLALPVVTAATEVETKCCSCKSYPMTATVNLPKTGFVPGETLAVKIDVLNSTSWAITQIEIGITATMIYTANRDPYEIYSYGPPVMNKIQSNTVTSRTVAVNSTGNTSGTYTLQVPPLTPSFADCPIIKISYSLFVRVRTDAVFSSGPELQIPITIGSVPLQANQPPAANVLANANFTQITITQKADEKDKEGPPVGYHQPQVPFYPNLTPATSATSTAAA